MIWLYRRRAIHTKSNLSAVTLDEPNLTPAYNKQPCCGPLFDLFVPCDLNWQGHEITQVENRSSLDFVNCGIL